MRRKVGVSVVKDRKEEKDKYNKIGKTLEENKIAAVKDMVSKFKVTLSEFARKYKDRINSDPEFRQQFHKMCLSVGVDPLASNKGFWADILGVGDFYYELGVKIINISVQTRSANGGIISMADMLQTLNKNLSNHKKKHLHRISEDDLLRAIEHIAILGNGFRVLKVGGKKMIVSVPMEISNDVMQLMTISQSQQGMISFRLLSSQYNWSSERFGLAIHPLLVDGLLWLDQHQGEVSYFFPSIWKDCILEERGDLEDLSSMKV